MSPSRLRKRISRALMVSWRDQPTRYDIEALQANTRRVGLVIRVRWVLLVVLVVYSLVAGIIYTTAMPFAEFTSRMVIPAIALGFVVVYNAFYQLNYRRLGNIVLWNNLQLTLDALVVTVLVYFSGGVTSWFWSMYSLFILEAAFILPNRRDAWGLAGISVILLGAIEGLEFLHVLPHVMIPFADGELHANAAYVSVRFGWQAAVLIGTAAIATQLVGEQRAGAARSQSLVVLDEITGLYSRDYFLRALGVEIRRARRDARPLHVLLIDIDRFGEFNRRFGIDAGDKMLNRVSMAISEGVAATGDVRVTTNLAARYGGEEFAILFAEDDEIDGAPKEKDALRLAETLRKRIDAQAVAGAGVTVSIGVASLSTDGASVDELLGAADYALSAAIGVGGNRAIAASSLEPATSGYDDLDHLGE